MTKFPPTPLHVVLLWKSIPEKVQLLRVVSVARKRQTAAPLEPPQPIIWNHVPSLDCSGRA